LGNDNDKYVDHKFHQFVFVFDYDNHHGVVPLPGFQMNTLT